MFNHVILYYCVAKYKIFNLGGEATKCTDNLMQYYNNGTQLNRPNRYCMCYKDDVT